MSEGATPEEIGLMRHMLGADSPRPGFRNYGAWEPDDARLKAMEKKGMVKRTGQPSWAGGLVYYSVSDEWRKALGIPSTEELESREREARA